MPLTTLMVANKPTIEHNDGAQPSQRKVRKSSAYASASGLGSISFRMPVVVLVIDVVKVHALLSNSYQALLDNFHEQA